MASKEQEAHSDTNIPLSLNPNATLLPGVIKDVAGDGHCLLHSVIESFSALGINITHRELCEKLLNEIVLHSQFYEDFSTGNLIVGMGNYLFKKKYNTSTCDLAFWGGLCNTLNATIIVHNAQAEHFLCLAIPQDVQVLYLTITSNR